jgi:Concanavalin A-like lectin/glucanases superfamily
VRKFIFLASILTLALPATAVALPTPVAVYDFDSSSSGTTFSTGSPGIPLTLHDGAAVSGGRLVLDGVDDYTESRNSAFQPAPNGDFSVSVWATSNNWGFSWQPLVFEDDDTFNTYSWAIYGTTNHSGAVRAYVRIRDGATLDTLELGGGVQRTLSDGAWHHLALSVEGRTVSFYFDGTQIDHRTSSLANGTVNFATDHLFVGGDTYFDSEKFGGFMDDVRYFDQPIDDTDVAHLSGT